MAGSKTKFTDLWHDPIRDALYRAVSGANRDVEDFIAARLPSGEIREDLRVRGVYWDRNGRIPKEIEMAIWFPGEKTTRKGGTQQRKSFTPIQAIVNTLVRTGKIDVPSENGMFRLWQENLVRAWEAETNRISRKGT